MRTLHKLVLLIVGLSLSSAFSCYLFRGAEISVVNDTAQKIYDVQLYGKGYNVQIGSLEPGVKATVKVHPMGESSVIVAYVTSAGRKANDCDIYIEDSASYKVIVTIKSDHSVKATYARQANS